MDADANTLQRARSLFFEGIAHYEGGRLVEAESAFRASLALLPARPSTLSNLGATLLKLDRPEEALAVLGLALAAAPDEAEALGHRAHALNVLGRPQQALQDIARFVALHPQRPEGWFHHGQTLQRLGLHTQALASYERTLALMPEHVQAWSNRGGALNDLGRSDEAAASFERAIALGADPELNRYYLAAIRGGAAPRSAPRAFVQNLFDSYADGFDEHLVQVLGYRAPEQLAQLLHQHHPQPFASALDLGCGTGLCAPPLRPRVARLEGVDLSAPMLGAAAARRLYDELVQADVAEHLQRTARRHDLVIAADVLIYLGELTALFSGVARVLEPGGIFAFSVERADDEHDFVLQPSMRYSQSERYLRSLAAAHGLVPLHLQHGVLRHDREHRCDGLYVLLERNGGVPV